MSDIGDNVTDDAKILIVDDDPQMLTMLQRMLQTKDIASITCLSAGDALEILREKDIKLVLLDINMPKMTGLELLEKMIEITPSVNVIMITGLGDIEIAHKCMKLGAKDYITKPFDLEYLETSVLAELIPLI